MNTTTTKGFTLIELLVVVAIIGILAAIVLSALGSAREKARDARREADIKSIQNALEVYYVENGHYPDSFAMSGSGTHWTHNYAVSSDSSWEALEAEMGVTLPVDPVNDGDNGIVSIRSTDNPELFGYAYVALDNDNQCHLQAYMLIYNKETADQTGPGGITLCNGLVDVYNNAFVVGVSPVQ